MEDKPQANLTDSEDYTIMTDQALNTLSRRSMLRYLVSFSILSTMAGVLTPIVTYMVPPLLGNSGGGGRVRVASTTDIPVGQGKVVSMGNKPVIVTHTTQGPRAFSAICTHLGCICTWDQTRQVIVCPCHDGLFNPVTGAVVGGPPPAPLPTVSVSIDGEDIYVGDV